MSCRNGEEGEGGKGLSVKRVEEERRDNRKEVGNVGLGLFLGMMGGEGVYI
jgi:hypothetical protein